MSFLYDIFNQLKTAEKTTVLRELNDQESPQQVSFGVTGKGLLMQVSQARRFLAGKGLRKGDRCALLAHNSIEWVAMDLAIMAEGLIVVPLYARQAPAELVAMMKDCSPSLLCCSDVTLRDAITQHWPEAPPRFLFDEIFTGPRDLALDRLQVAESDPVTIIYTSGTSGEAKGVVLTAGNVGHMLGCTSGRLDLLMEGRRGQDCVFHYLPFWFAGSWIMLLTCLLRRSLLTLNTDLNKLAADMRTAAPYYFLNIPALLERMRKAVDEQLWKTGGIVRGIYGRAKAAWVRKQESKARLWAGVWLRVANTAVFPSIRKKMIGGNLRALICGSAPLNVETQLFFMMLGIPVLQVYGLTETTAICTMDDPAGQVEPGRVGPAIAGIEMKLGEQDEIVVRGTNVFAGYWKRPEETAKVLRDQWFYTGDQGEVNAAGNWKVVGRIKNLIVLGSGHNIAPEPIEEALLQQLPGGQVVLIGNGRGYLSAVVTGDVAREKVQSAIDLVNAGRPHYKQIRAFQVRGEPFSIENGLLTANGKLKRDAIAAKLHDEIEEMYQVKQAV